MLKRFFLFMLVFLPLTAPNAQTTGIISIKNKKAPETFEINKHPVAAPTSEFFDEKGKTVSLSDFKGKILLVNIWTTSCPQCVIELPMLDRLQKDMGGVKFQVVAISSDFEPLPLLRRFWVNRGIKNLKIFYDPQALFAQAADVKGLPTTFLIDEKGREVGRIKGITEWDGPKIKAQIRDLIRAAKENAKKEKEQLETAASKATDSAESVSAPSIQRSKEIQSWFKK